MIALARVKHYSLGFRFSSPLWALESLIGFGTIGQVFWRAGPAFPELPPRTSMMAIGHNELAIVLALVSRVGNDSE